MHARNGCQPCAGVIDVVAVLMFPRFFELTLLRCTVRHGRLRFQ